MRSAYIAMSYRMHAKNKVKDLRTSAMSIALEKIALSYDTLGLKKIFLKKIIKKKKKNFFFILSIYSI